MKKGILIIATILTSISINLANAETSKNICLAHEDGIDKADESLMAVRKRKEKDTTGIRKGWTFGALPSVSYDADLGFQYGALTNIYYFGDGSTYPEYLHSFYVEASYTTKRYGVFRLFYDSKYLIPKHRLTIDASYLPDAMCDFYGFNGYQTVFNDKWKNSKKYSAEEGYRSRAYYKFKRDLFRFSADIQGNLSGNYYWNAGIGVLGYGCNTVDVKMLNKGKKEAKKLPEIDVLYDKYVQWGLIGANEKNGGWHPYVHAGLTYDSRDKQQNPSKGIYADVFLTYNAAFGAQKEFNNMKVNADFRHYVPIYKDWISFAYRVGVQLTTYGKSPFYLNTYMNNLYIQRVIYEGPGGGNSVRGVLRNRVLANGFGFANVEFRLKACKFKIRKEHFYIGFNPFVDMGMVLQPYDLDKNEVIKSIKENDPDFNLDELSDYLTFNKKSIYRPHLSAGIGLKIAMNENFILSVDWAVPFDTQDGASKANFYVKIGYMF